MPLYDEALDLTEEEGLEALEAIRWPDGFRCPACDNTKAWKTSRGHYRCSACQRQTSVLAGTGMAGTRIPVREWLRVMRELAECSGISAASLADRWRGEDGLREYGRVLGTYKTAWTMLHKLRVAMKPGEEDRLRGRVEIGTGTLEAVHLGLFGRDGKRQVQVLVAMERKPGQQARCLFMRKLQAEEPAHVLNCLREGLEYGEVTSIQPAREGWKTWLAEEGFRLSREEEPGVTVRIQWELDRLQKRLGEVYVGEISAKHLDAYMDEYAFHENHRRGGSNTADVFDDLLARIVWADPVSFEEMTRRDMG